MTAPAPSTTPHRRFSGRHTFAVLVENPDYRRYFLGHGISLTGTWIQQAAVLWMVFEMTGSEWWTGAVEAAGLLPGFFVGLVAGALADRVPPKRLVVCMLVSQMILAFSLAALVGTGRIRLWQMAAILALTRVCVTFEMPSRQVFMYRIVGQGRIMNAIALNSGLFNASRVFGPAVAGVVLVQAGATSCFVLNAFSFLAAIAAVLSIRSPVEDRAAAGSVNRAILGGFAYLRTDRLVRNLFLLMIAFGVIGMGYSALIPSYARKVVQTGPRGYSLLLSCIGVGATLGALFVAGMGSMRQKQALVLGGITGFGLAMAAAAILPRLAVGAGMPALALALGCVCVMAAGFGGILFYASTQTLIQLAVPDQLRGRIVGLWMIGFSASVPLGALWAGWAASTYGVARVLQVMAAVSMVLAFVAVWTRAVVDEPARPAPELAA